jgi:hypothetical protein
LNVILLFSPLGSPFFPAKRASGKLGVKKFEKDKDFPCTQGENVLYCHILSARHAGRSG